MRTKLPGSVLLALLGVVLAGGQAPTTLVGPDLPERPVRELQLAAAPDGTLVLAVIADDVKASSGRGTFMSRTLTAWTSDGTTWRPLGSGEALNYDRPRPLSSLNLALDASGTPVLVWNENYGDNDIVVFRAFQGGDWTQWRSRYLGDDLPYAARTRAVVARAGEPVLAWGEYLRKPDGSRLTVRAWTGTTWSRSVAFNDLRQFSRTPALALNGAGNPVVAWLQGDVLASDVLVSRWTGEQWERLGTPVNRRGRTYLASTRLVLDRAGRPVVAWLEDVSGRDTLFAARWDGTAWRSLGGAVSVHQASSPSLALDAGGQAVLSWVEERGGPGTVHAARWSGSAWQRAEVLNADPSRDARSPSLALGASGGLVVAWREDDRGVYRVRLRRLAFRVP